MVGLSEVNLGELPPFSQISEYVIDAWEWVLLCLKLGVNCDLKVATNSLSRRFSSTSTLGFMAYGTGLALQNFG